ncbi:MAG: tetratricopeptide repeat protein, partial [Acidobacteriota bacterium]
MGDVRLDEARRFAAAGRLQEAAATLKNLLGADPENQEARSLLMELQDRMLLELQVREKLKKARALAEGGQKEEALRLAREILKISPESPEVHRFLQEAEAGAPPAPPSPFDTVVSDAADLLPEFAPSPSPTPVPPPAPALEELPELRLDALDLPSPPTVTEGTVLSGASSGSRLAPAEAQKVAQYLAEGKAHFEAGRYQDAIDAWTRIFIVDEENGEAQALIDQARERMGAHQEEIEHLLTEGIGAFNSGEYERAQTLLERILSVFPTHREAQYYLDRLEEMKKAPPPPPPPADTFELEDNLFTPTGPEMRTGAAAPPPAAAPAPPSPFASAGEPSEFQLETGGAEDIPFPAAPAAPPSPPAPPVPSGEPAPFAWDEPLPASFREAAAPAPPAPPPSERPAAAPERPAPAPERAASAPARAGKPPSLKLVVGVFAALVVLGTGIFFGA